MISIIIKENKKMPINDNDSRVKRTKKLIKKGLAELSKTKNITKITVKELTDYIEINRGTFYLHYKDINELVKALSNEAYDEIEKCIADVDANLVLQHPLVVLEKFCKLIQENNEEFTMLAGVNGDNEFVNRAGKLLGDKVYSLLSEIYPNMSMERYNMSYEYVKFGALGLLNCWLTQHPELTPHQVAEMWLTLLTKGLSAILDDKIMGYWN